MHRLFELDFFTLKPLLKHKAKHKAKLMEDVVAENHEIYNERTQSFHFRATQRSLFPGKLVSFGTLPELNDFLLPDGKFWQFVSPPSGPSMRESLSAIVLRDSI